MTGWAFKKGEKKNVWVGRRERVGPKEYCGKDELPHNKIRGGGEKKCGPEVNGTKKYQDVWTGGGSWLKNGANLYSEQVGAPRVRDVGETIRCYIEGPRDAVCRPCHSRD